jgi:hypothetical protein
LTSSETSNVSPESSLERLPLATRACLALIHFYRRYLSPLKPPSCRFTPTCSQYALDAYTHFGVTAGTWKTLTRLARCHSWHPGGPDPVIKHAKDHPKKKTQ